MPVAVGAKVAAPDRQVVALSGDGGLMFTLGELATAAELGTSLPVVVFANEGYGEIRNEMRAQSIAPLGVDLPLPDLPAVARGLGGAGVAVDDADALARELADALERPGPTVVVVPEPLP